VLNVRGFYEPLMTFLDHQRDEGFVKPGLRDTLLSATDPDQLLDAMEAYDAAGRAEMGGARNALDCRQAVEIGQHGSR
jgi:predicted Rossmann-fold nucleotide-binding protein